MLLKKLRDDDLFLFFFTVLTVLASRLPFLLPGYGFDPDAWGVAFISRQIATTGTYYVSRFPGYPVQEFFYSIIWKSGPLLMNGMTALLSGLATAFFALSMKKMEFAQPFFSALVFAFVPVVYVNSVTSIDYVWALCFVLGSLYCVLSDRPVFAGLLLGLAIPALGNFVGNQKTK